MIERPLYRRGRLALSALAIAGAGTLLFASARPATATSTTTTTTTVPTSTTTTTTSPTTTTTSPPKTTLQWPRVGSAAVAVPQLSVAASSPNQPRVPIASLTKLMSAWVVLHRLPLAPGQTGPCEIVDASDLAQYNFDIDTDQSSVKIVLGEQLCEPVLLRGMLVHSAANYAQLLVTLTGWHEATFVAVMNRDALTLGMKKTHYVDVTGISSGDRSTAQDQATLTALLMTEEPIVPTIVTLPTVNLPVVGATISFTPFVGTGNVVGVKSGYTNAAGGCDVMAVDDYLGTTEVTTYAVVLGEHGANAIGTAGVDALVLSRSIRTLMGRVVTPTGVQIEWLGSPSDVVAPTTSPTAN